MELIKDIEIAARDEKIDPRTKQKITTILQLVPKPETMEPKKEKEVKILLLYTLLHYYDIEKTFTRSLIAVYKDKPVKLMPPDKLLAYIENYIREEYYKSDSEIKPEQYGEGILRMVLAYRVIVEIIKEDLNSTKNLPRKAFNIIKLG